MSITEIRQQIDRIDRDIVRLLQQRAHLAMRAANLKRTVGMPIRDQGRENAVLAKVTRIHGPMSGDAIREIFEVIIRKTREMEAHAPTEG